MGSFKEHRPPALRPRLLVLDEDATLVEALSCALQPNVPRLRIDTCSSAAHARQLLFTSSYHGIVCSPSLTVTNGISVLTYSHRIQPSIPFLMTLRADERDLARHWLDLGVYDFIFSPLDPGQVLESVRQAFLLSKRRASIAHKERVLVYLSRRQMLYHTSNAETPLRHEVSKLLQDSILRIEESAESLKQTVKRIEASLKGLERTCQNNELHARQRALDRLKHDLAR